MRVGFIGLGIMGASMAANLQKAGHQLAVHDIRRQAAASHLAAGAEWKDTPRQVSEATDVVFTSLPTPGEETASNVSSWSRLTCPTCVRTASSTRARLSAPSM